MWTVGVVKELITSRDGLIHSVMVNHRMETWCTTLSNCYIPWYYVKTNRKMMKFYLRLSRSRKMMQLQRGPLPIRPSRSSRRPRALLGSVFGIPCIPAEDDTDWALDKTAQPFFSSWFRWTSIKGHHRNFCIICKPRPRSIGHFLIQCKKLSIMKCTLQSQHQTNACCVISNLHFCIISKR